MRVAGYCLLLVSIALSLELALVIHFNRHNSAVSKMSAGRGSNSSPARPQLSAVLSWPDDRVQPFLEDIYEHSGWVVEGLLRPADSSSTSPDRPWDDISSIGELHRAMKGVVDSASRDQKLALLRAHPDLCERVESLAKLTASSQEEQSRAGLHSLTDEERTSFKRWNDAYRAKFGFPFILAVRNSTKYTVLASIESRVKNSKDVEFTAALSQVHKIAWMRLLSAIELDAPKGFLTCHVLDTANGTPAANMRLHLKRVAPEEHAGFLAEYRTNEDGRLPGGPALKGEQFQVGVYEWTFFVGDYFATKANVETSAIPFLSEVPIRFGLDDPDAHYHVPLLVSPWSYSTYRGS